MRLIQFLKKHITLNNILLYGVIILTGSYLLSCANATDTADIHIYITNSTSPIEHAQVYINNGSMLISNHAGYVGANIPIGETTIRVQYVGHIPYTTTMTIVEDSDIHIKLQKPGISFYGLKELFLVGFLIIFISVGYKFGKKMISQRNKFF